MLVLALNLFVAIAAIIVTSILVISAIKAAKIAFTSSEKEVIANVTS